MGSVCLLKVIGQVSYIKERNNNRGVNTMETRKRNIIIDNKQITFNYRPMLGTSSTKTIKGESKGYSTAILYLAPSTTAKDAGFNVKNTCNAETPECKKACLFKAGRGAFSNVEKARLEKTRFLLEDTNILKPNEDAILSIIIDIQAHIKKSKRRGLIPCVRLNGTSDLPFHLYEYNGVSIMDMFRSVQFYDYTKHYFKAKEFANDTLPINYHITFSYTGYNIKECIKLLNQGVNVAVVFDNGFPNEFLGYKVLNGDKTDLTFTYPKGHIVGLNPKGNIDKESAFIVDTNKLHETIIL